jgi:FHA domain/Integrin beta chain VWA domain
MRPTLSAVARWTLPLAALCAIQMSVAPRAMASLNVTVGNPGLQHFDADGAVELDFGVTSQDGQPVGNLQPSNVQVFEDGKPAKIVDFRGVGQGRPVDIVFVIDVTQSMQPYIDAIKRNMITFAHDLAEHNRDYRLGLVTFEDYVVSAYPDCNCAYRNTLTPDVNRFIKWVGTLHASGGGDIPEDQLDALAYASKLPFRPQAQAILILITDAPCHLAGDGPDREGDEAYRQHTKSGADVTNLTGPQVATMLKRQGLTLYAVAPPPFIEPAYAEIVKATHGRSFNIVTEENRFPELVREIGHSIATEYSLSYRTPRPIEDGTDRSVKLKVSYNGQSGYADTSYQVHGVSGARINVPEGGAGGAGSNMGGTGLLQLSFNWWNLMVPLIAIGGLLGLSRVHFGVSAEELKAIVEAQNRPAPPPRPSTGRAPATAQPRPPARTSSPSPPLAAGSTGPHEARLSLVQAMDPVPAEYSLLKDEVSLGRGEDNDVVIPHPSVSRAHARLMRRNGLYELTDLNSTNGTYVNEQPVHGSVRVGNGSEVRLGDVRFVLRY